MPVKVDGKIVVPKSKSSKEMLELKKEGVIN
jgi:hypothetical protein